MDNSLNLFTYIKYNFNRIFFHFSLRKDSIGLESIPIDNIIRPFGYGIFIRYKFFVLYENNIDLCQKDFNSFFQLALESDYFVWYKHIAYPFHRNVFRDRQNIQSSFRNRVLKSIALYYSFKENGFDVSQPIVLQTGKNIRETTTDAKPFFKYYAGNGCHRIALLWLSGAKSIAPEQYIVREYKYFFPVDNTSLLLQYIPLIKSEYLALGFHER